MGMIYNPEYSFNLFSMTKRFQNRWVLFRNYKNILLTKGDKKIKFDQEIPMLCQSIHVVFIKEQIGMIATESGTKISIQHMHKSLDNVMKKLQKIHKAPWLSVKYGETRPCESFANATAKHENVTK